MNFGKTLGLGRIQSVVFSVLRASRIGCSNKLFTSGSIKFNTQSGNTWKTSFKSWLNSGLPILLLFIQNKGQLETIQMTINHQQVPQVFTSKSRYRDTWAIWSSRLRYNIPNYDALICKPWLEMLMTCQQNIKNVGKCHYISPTTQKWRTDFTGMGLSCAAFLHT